MFPTPSVAEVLPFVKLALVSVTVPVALVGFAWTLSCPWYWSVIVIDIDTDGFATAFAADSLRIVVRCDRIVACMFPGARVTN